MVCLRFYILISEHLHKNIVHSKILDLNDDTVETRVVGSELNIFSNNLWHIYQYQLADYCTHTGIY